MPKVARPRRVALAMLFSAFLLVAVSCGGDGDTGEPASPTPTATTPTGGAASVAITMQDNRFDPASLTISVTQAIELSNEGTALHNLTIEGTPVDVDVQPGQSQTLSPPGDAIAPDSYRFFCEYHEAQGMEGTMEVTA
jgi:plastocyanin